MVSTEVATAVMTCDEKLQKTSTFQQVNYLFYFILLCNGKTLIACLLHKSWLSMATLKTIEKCYNSQATTSLKWCKIVNMTWTGSVDKLGNYSTVSNNLLIVSSVLGLS